MNLERRAVRLVDTKATDLPGTFAGYGAVFGNTDGQGDMIQAGAFADSLKDWQARGKWPPMLLQHGGGFFGGGADDMLPIGQWTEMEENARGLKVEGALFALATERGQYIYEGLKAGVLDGLSIGFRTVDAKPAPRDSTADRILTAIDLWEVSIVTFPANPKARVSTVKSLTLETLREIERPLYEDLRDAGYSHVDIKRIVGSLRKYLQRDAGGPDSEHRDGAADGDGAGSLLEALRARTDSRLAGALQTQLTASGGRHV